MPVSVSVGNCCFRKGEKSVFWRASKYPGRPGLFSVCSAGNCSTEKTQGEKATKLGNGLWWRCKKDEKKEFQLISGMDTYLGGRSCDSAHSRGVILLKY